MSPTTKPAAEVPAKSVSPSKTNGRNINGREAAPPRPTNSQAQQQSVPESGPATDAPPPAHEWRIVTIPVERIEPSPYQPRLSFDADEMNDLIASVRAKGVQQPIIVRTCKADQEALQQVGLQRGALQNGTVAIKSAVAKDATTKRHGTTQPNLVRYELIAGERRLRASKEAKRRTIPAILRDDLSDAECAELALLENVQRSNLSVIEEARAYKRLMLQFRMKEERIAKKVGKSVGTIRDMLKLLQLPEPVQKLLATKKLTASHGQELLSLATFERVCVLVAEHAARNSLTAVSLQATPLPNVPELKRLKLLMELDWNTKFDWKQECGQCPHKAYVTNGYGSYCLKPDEWHKKQAAAIEQQKQEATRIMEEARQVNGQPLEAGQLTPGSFRNLTHSMTPAGCCEQCPCRSEMTDPTDPTKRIPICLDPNRHSELVQAERQAHEDARRQKYRALWLQAKNVLHADVESHALGRLATILSLPVLQAEFCRYIDREQWVSLARTVGASVGILVPWDDLLNEGKEPGELYPLLQEKFHMPGERQEPRETPAQPDTEKHLQEPEKLLLLCVCLLLAYETNQTVRFGGDTPMLDFVLGHSRTQQPELEDQSEAGPHFETGPASEENHE